MKKLIMLTAALATFFSSSYADDKMIYGDDDRADYFAMSAGMKDLANSVVSLWESSSVKLDAESNSYTLETQNFGERLNLCPDERFREQAMGAFCSGSLVGEDMIMTAGHCITDEAKCADTKFVFGFSVNKQDSPAAGAIPLGEVYSCKKIIKRQLGPEPNADNPQGAGLGADYALVQLDRKVRGHKVLDVNRQQKLKKGDPMFVIGHPVGLPLKLADGATVRDPEPKGYFVADLDTYGGNSGSPVFNSVTKLIEGILVRGDTDFERTPQGCTVSYRVPQDEGRGEDVTKISALAAHIPAGGKALDNSEPRVDMAQIQKETYSFIENSGGIDFRGYSFDGK